MKTLLGGSKCMRLLPRAARDAITGLIANQDNLLVGDCLGTDLAVQELLATLDYRNVTIYTSFASAHRNEGSWQEHSCHPDDYALPATNSHLHLYQFQAIKDQAMALDADRGLIIWDGLSRDALLDILMLACLGKPVLVIGPSATTDIATIEDVHGILQKRNPRHCPGEGILPIEETDKIIDTFIPSREMSGFLKTQHLAKNKLIDIILGSPVPLRAKYETCGRCAYLDDVMHEVVDVVADHLETYPGGESRKVAFVQRCWERTMATSFSTHYEAFRKALKALHVSGGRLLYRDTYWDDRPEFYDDPHSAGAGPFSSLESALEDLRDEIRFEEWDDDSPCWSELDDSHPSKTRGWCHDYTFYLIQDQVIFFDKNYYDSRSPHWRPTRNIFPDESRYCGDDIGRLSLPTPFKMGDIVTLNCRPFAPLCHGLVLISEYAADGTFPTVLLRQQGPSPELGDGNWNSWSLKSCGGLRVCAPGYSPLYHVGTYEGRLLDGEEILAEVSRWLGGDSSKAQRLDEALLDTGHGMDDEELRLYMERSD